jgi:GTP-binding protein EngB required for normal cell division
MSLSNFVLDKKELIKLWLEVKFQPRFACNKCDKINKENVEYLRNPFNTFGVSFVSHGGSDSVLYSVSGKDLYDPNSQKPSFGNLASVSYKT